MAIKTLRRGMLTWVCKATGSRQQGLGYVKNGYVIQSLRTEIEEIVTGDIWRIKTDEMSL